MEPIYTEYKKTLAKKVRWCSESATSTELHELEIATL